ncbi:hypothetical protein AAF712_001245 [Marasmius tenuissimus]|uniref:Uncharacterized protein n=1 Tax=Marasmius tenuissimus TaxID=585030 RepID=A0ABR3AED8_9AGAR
MPAPSKGRVAGLSINTSFHSGGKSHRDPSPSPNLSLPNDIPSFLVSGSPTSPEKPPVSPLAKAFKGGSQKEGGRKNETRKLLGHVLSQLSQRKMPPTVYDTFGVYGDRADEKSPGIVESVKGAVKGGGGNHRSTESLGLHNFVVDEDDEPGVFSTDETFELMVQLRDVLMIFLKQGWTVFDDSMDEGVSRSNKSSSPFRRSIGNLQPGSRRSRSPSPGFGKRNKAEGLLPQCISILSSVVLEDCRYKVASPRPSRPPNALQSLTLEVSQFLLHTHRHSPKIVSEIALALIPAFSTFPYEYCGRLLAFFEECVVRSVLGELRSVQGLSNNSSDVEPSARVEGLAPGAISIQVDAAPDEGSNVDSDWAWSTASSKLLALKSTNAPMQQAALYNLSSIIGPLLSAILERFEFDAESNSRADVTYRLHRLITVIADLKFDAYLDILAVLAYHTSRAKRLAAHLLATFWPRAVGHAAISRAPMLEILSTGAQAPSPGTMDFFQYNSPQHKDYSIIFDWSYLVFVSAAIKMPLEPPSNGSGLLTISTSFVDSGGAENREDDASHPFEIVPLSHLRDGLGYEFHFRCDSAAKFMLSHLHHMGFIERLDSEATLFDSDNKHVHCTFPLPLGLDVSSDVETLFAAVEACLSDLDLFVNEIGWLLLSRRLWPSGSASQYALGRLTRSILLWILAEDEDLATILRDYLAKQRALPGVRSARDPPPWPPIQSSRQAPSSSINNGGDYVASRRALVNRYAIPWLAALHDQSPENYAMILYDICNEVVENTSVSETTWDVLHDAEEIPNPEKHEKILRLMLRLSQNSIMFTASEAIFVRWLSIVTSYDLLLSSSSLTRVFQSEADASQRYSVLDNTTAIPDGLSFNPWDLVASTASGSGEGLRTALRWLRIFALSGVTVPFDTLDSISSLVANSSEAASQFTHVLLLATWQRPTNREQTQKLVASLHLGIHRLLIENLHADKQDAQSLTVVRQSLAVCLLAYGCDRQKILGDDLVLEDEIKGLTSRRAVAHRASTIVDPIVVDSSLMRVLKDYLSVNNDNITCIIAKFLNCFLMSTPYLETHEVDNFILRNGQMLCNSAFQFYGVQRQELLGLRFGFLLRVVIVDTQPFKEILERSFKQDGEWELRLSAVTKVFRLILDITSPAQTVEGRQWRSSITDAFYYFFVSLWADEKQEIRVAVETLCSTLLPSHLDEISLCWTELLATSPIAERVRLTTFLIQLRHHFPSWAVVSWHAMLEILAEDQYQQEGGNKRDGALTSHLSMYGLASAEDDISSVDSAEDMENEMTNLRVSTLLLSLDMAASGLIADFNELLKMKVHVARMLGLADARIVPTQDGPTFYVHFADLIAVPGYAFPCINQLLSLLDSPHPVVLSTLEGPARGDSRNSTPLLIGSIFIDVLLALFTSVGEIMTLPILTVKSLLESVGVIIYKHDFEHMYIRPTQSALKKAITMIMDIMLEDINLECRQLALYVTQAYIKKFHGTMRSLIHYSIEQVAKLVVSQSHATQDSFVDQAKSFLEYTLKTYSANGIFIGLLKRKLDRSIFTVLKQVLDANAKENRGTEGLREALLRDSLPRAVETDQDGFQNVLNNLQTYVEVVHHQNYSKELMILVGHHLTLLARRFPEWNTDTVNPAPLFNIASVLMQHNKAQSREMLVYTETILRATLIRLTIDVATVSRLVQVTSSLFRRSGQEATNPIIMALFEISSDLLRKSSTPSATTGALIETLMTTQVVGFPLMTTYHGLFQGLAGSGLQFLFNFPWTWGDGRSNKDFTVSLTVAKLVLTVASRDPAAMVRVGEQGTEKCGKQSMAIRGWSILVLAALMEDSDDWADLILSQLGPLSVAHHAALRSYIQPTGAITDSAIADINHAYIAIKIWLILAQRKSAKVGAGNDVALKVWDTLWPPFETLVQTFETEVQAGLPMANAGSIDVVDGCRLIAMLERLRSLGRGDTQIGKLSRAIRALKEPPSSLTSEGVIDQVAKDIIATEKLRELDLLGNREAAKGGAERRGVKQEHYFQGT